MTTNDNELHIEDKTVFVASLATESNTFAPIYTDLNSFQESLYALPGEHPDTPTLCSAPIVVARRRFQEKPWKLVEGTAAWAEPGGIVQRQTYELLRDEILDQLQEALPVKGVILGLHGAMVAEGYDDCEGDLIVRVRKMVGPDVTIAIEMDPHSHMTKAISENVNIIIAFKEFPHRDFVERAEEVVEFAIQHMEKKIDPVVSVFDCRMIDVLPTSVEPMKGFVEKIRMIEQRPGILSISVIHGFMAGDVPDMGTKIVVVTDGDKQQGEQLAEELGRELFSLCQSKDLGYVSTQEGISEAGQSKASPVVVADVWDNPGGGVAGDSTILLQELIDQNLLDSAVGTIWDPMAVRLCIAAGEGAQFNLRFGAKTGIRSGRPIDDLVTVSKIVLNAEQSFGQSVVPMGDSVVIRMSCGIEVILNSTRSQSFSPDLFSNMGINPLSKKILVVKSTNHFYDSFSRISDHIIYVDAGGPYPSNPATNSYKKLTRPIWPIVDNPYI